jgi:enamine deaminase RidA (YjgF/YER057c/UK114 family)
MGDRQLISSGAPWEAAVGYSRAVRVGDHVSVAGTVAVDDLGNVVAPGDAYSQTRAIFAIIGRALTEAGASLDDVVRTRSFITDLGQWEAFGRAHGEVFSQIRPASTLVEVSDLLGEGTVIEIEVDAVITRERP